MDNPIGSVEAIIGFNKLSDPAKKLFISTYENHKKSGWIPKKVEEHRNYLRVDFTNGEWLHYYPNGTWA